MASAHHHPPILSHPHTIRAAAIFQVAMSITRLFASRSAYADSGQAILCCCTALASRCAFSSMFLRLCARICKTPQFHRLFVI